MCENIVSDALIESVFKKPIKDDDETAFLDGHGFCRKKISLLNKQTDEWYYAWYTDVVHNGHKVTIRLCRLVDEFYIGVGGTWKEIGRTQELKGPTPNKWHADIVVWNCDTKESTEYNLDFLSVMDVLRFAIKSCDTTTEMK